MSKDKENRLINGFADLFFLFLSLLMFVGAVWLVGVIEHAQDFY